MGASSARYVPSISIFKCIKVYQPVTEIKFNHKTRTASLKHLQLYMKKPIFRAATEVQQLDLIFRMCGTPTPTTWPDVKHLRHYEQFRPKKEYVRRIQQDFKPYVRPFLVVDALMSFMYPDWHQPQHSTCLSECCVWIPSAALARLRRANTRLSMSMR